MEVGERTANGEEKGELFTALRSHDIGHEDSCCLRTDRSCLSYPTTPSNAPATHLDTPVYRISRYCEFTHPRSDWTRRRCMPVVRQFTYSRKSIPAASYEYHPRPLLRSPLPNRSTTSGKCRAKRGPCVLLVKCRKRKSSTSSRLIFSMKCRLPRKRGQYNRSQPVLYAPQTTHGFPTARSPLRRYNPAPFQSL